MSDETGKIDYYRLCVDTGEKMEEVGALEASGGKIVGVILHTTDPYWVKVQKKEES